MAETINRGAINADINTCVSTRRFGEISTHVHATQLFTTFAYSGSWRLYICGTHDARTSYPKRLSFRLVYYAADTRGSELPPIGDSHYPRSSLVYSGWFRWFVAQTPTSPRCIGNEKLLCLRDTSPDARENKKTNFFFLCHRTFDRESSATIFSSRYSYLVKKHAAYVNNFRMNFTSFRIKKIEQSFVIFIQYQKQLKNRKLYDIE